MSFTFNKIIVEIEPKKFYEVYFNKTQIFSKIKYAQSSSVFSKI